MHNLERIHSRFFPKSRTAPWGKKLIYLAWGIEILVAGVSLAIAYLFNFTDLLSERGPTCNCLILFNQVDLEIFIYIIIINGKLFNL